ncbi:MAG TPA: hypothetical protein VMR31_06475 [Myxococcota bacterium]|nr:hypothetical protein [Myxococcota bacterium]
MAERDDELAIETGGPTWQIWLRIGLAPAHPAPLARRALVLAGIAWLPPLLLSLRSGLAYGDAVPVPYLRDFSVYARFVFVVLVLTFADASVGARLRTTLLRFGEAKLVLPGSERAFLDAVLRARRRVASPLAEAVMLAGSYALAWLVLRRELGNGVSTWHALASGDGEAITGAGWWYVLVSLPIFYFLFLRWAYRGALWTALLGRISRLELRLVATHPDQAAGLGFLAHGQAGFAPLVLAASASLSSALGTQVIYEHAPLEQFYPTLAAFVVLVLVVVLAPLLAFAPRLVRLKHESLFEYGALATGHDDAFRAKWVRKDADRAALLGDPDPSSLADLGTGYDRVEAMRPFPFDRAAIGPIAVAAILPMLPLIATKVPLSEILKDLIKVVM